MLPQPSFIVGHSFRRVEDIVAVDFRWRRCNKASVWDMKDGVVKYAGGINELYGTPVNTVVFVTPGWEENPRLRDLESFAAARGLILVNAVTFDERDDYQMIDGARLITGDVWATGKF